MAFRPRLLLPLSAALLGLLAGCANPTSPNAIMDRVDANRAQYETWPLEIKEAILDGRVVRNMTPDMVYVARGKPTEVVDRGNGDFVWVYRKGGGSSASGGSLGGLSGSSISIGGGTGGVYMGGGPMIMSTPSPAPAYEPVDEDEVFFRNGVVVRGDGVEKK